MPIRVAVQPETGVATLTATGVLSLAEFEDASAAAWSHPQFTGTTILWDLRDAAFSFTQDEVARLASFDRARSTVRAPARTAFVVSHDFEFGLLRMFAAYRSDSDIDIRVFRDHAAAAGWLQETRAGRADTGGTE